MPVPAEFAAFDIATAGVTVWTFKKSGGAGGVAPTFTGKWVATDNALDTELKAAIQREIDRIEEVAPYGLLAQPNEASALSISTVETHAGLVIAAAADQLPKFRVTKLKQLENAGFYVTKLVSSGQVLYAFRKADLSWRSKKRLRTIDTLFDDQTLALEPRPAFSLSQKIDFIVLGDEILILNKGNFESVLSYRQAHADEFIMLQGEPEFSGIFTDLAPLVAFVGANKIQLRRACVIRSKGHYRDAHFIGRLRTHHAQYHLTLNFTPAGLIDPTPNTCSDIITALLDHRLSSAFSQTVYDVPDAVEVM